MAASTWPIAAAMLPFSSQQDADPTAWAASLAQVARAGFRFVDPTDSWLRVADLDPVGLTAFQEVVADAGLVVPAISTARRSVIDPRDGDDNLAYSHRVIDTAAALGARHVSVSLMRPLTPAQRHVTWFWTVPGDTDPSDDSLWDAAVTRLRELGTHAASVGIELSLEMYEDTYLGTADSSVRFVRDVDHPAVGLNPDLGNLQRLHRPVERWEVMAEKTIPYANYWHVKNYFRTEDATTGAIVTAPAPLELGVINYRRAVRMAIDSGFRGAFCTEHYGGDGLSVSATNREYLRRILPRSASHH